MLDRGYIQIFFKGLLYVFTCCTIGDLEVVDSEVGERREVRKRCHCDRYPFVTQPLAMWGVNFSSNRLCHVSVEVNDFDNDGRGNLQLLKIHGIDKTGSPVVKGC